MKRYGFWDRALVFLFAALSAAMAVMIALRAFNVDLIGDLCDNLSANTADIVWKLIICGLGAILLLLAFYVIMLITPSRERKSDFITLDTGDGNHVRIALPAIRDMAKQAVSSVDGLSDIAIDVSGEGDSITVSMSMDVDSGTHVPSMTGEIQRTVKRYIEEKCGVGVRGVMVTVKSVLPNPPGWDDSPKGESKYAEQDEPFDDYYRGGGAPDEPTEEEPAPDAADDDILPDTEAAFGDEDNQGEDDPGEDDK